MNYWPECSLLTVGLLGVAFMLAGCKKAPQSEALSSNPEIRVGLLFEHEGVRVYRFYDEGRAIYYTDARGKTEWHRSNGKVATHHEVNTVE